MSLLTDKVRSRGHWEVVIRPSTFDLERVPWVKLMPIIDKASVRLRGWPVPLVDGRNSEPTSGEDWIGQDVDAEVVAHFEAWRFFTSGQFSHLRAINADWRVGSEMVYVPPGASSVVEVWEILFYVTEVFELAARLALTEAGDDYMVVDATVHTGQGRVLVVGQHNRHEFMSPYRVPPKIQRTTTISRQDLVAAPHEAAVLMSHELFNRCGWEPSREELAEHQAELLNYR